MAETVKSVLFVIATVMIALIVQAHAGKLGSGQYHAEDESSQVEQTQHIN